MSKSKKVLAMFLCATMVASMCSFTGCSKKSKNKDGEITFMFWDNFTTSQDLTTKNIAKTVDRFNEKYKDKGWKVKPIFTSNDSHDAKLSAMIQGKKTPDVFIANPGAELQKYATQLNATADLTDVLRKDEKAWGDSFIQGFLKPLTFDNKIMAVPLNYAASCVFYNKDIFKEAGVEVPKTFDDLIKACETIKAKKIKNVESPIVVGGKDKWCLSMHAGYLCNRAGVNLDDFNSGKTKWAESKEAKDACAKLQELSKYYQASYKNDSNEVATDSFALGKAAILIQGQWALGQISGKNPDFKNYGVMEFPSIGDKDGSTLVAKTDNICMSKDTKNKEAAIALMKMLTDDETQKAGAIAGKMASTTTANPDYDKASPQIKEISVVADKALKQNKVIDFYNESMITKECADTFDAAMCSVAFGDQDADTALKQIDKVFETALQNKK